MKPISIGLFAFGVGLFVLFWIAWKPIMDALNDLIPGIAGNDFEVAYFELLPFIIMAIILVSLLVMVTKRNRDE